MPSAARSTAAAPTAFELKSAALTLISVVLKTADLARLREELSALRGESPGLFEGEAVVVDVSPLRETDEALDFGALLTLLREHQMAPVAVKGAQGAMLEAAQAAGLAEAPEGAVQPVRTAVGVEPPVAAPAPAPAPVARAAATVVVDRPLRSGQQVYARGRDLVVMAMVNPGAEVIADGHIHVYAPLRGKAIAGARGNAEARIFALSMDPELISIAGIYRTSDNPLPADVLGKTAQVRLVPGPDGDKLVIDPLNP
jgi:septum site-determining protein MinC